jgi:broad specificity phosphatase PhoE
VETTVFLVRHGVTDWHRERRLVGQRDIPLNDDGMAQARDAADLLADLGIGEVISSPLLRAVQTAEIIARRFGADVTRDPRLAELRYGRWEGLTHDELAESADFKRFLTSPLVERLPGGEDLAQGRDRAIGAVEQALRDAPAGERLAVVTHASIIRLVVCHYLGVSLAAGHRLPVVPGSLSVLSFRDDRDPPRVRAIGWRARLKEVL